MKRSICFVIFDLNIVGGVEKVAENLANRLADNYIVHIVSLHGTTVNPALRFEKSISITHFNLSQERLRRQMFSGSYLLYKYFKKHQIEIAFLEATFAGFIGAPLGMFSKTKIVFCDHGALYNQLDDKDITSMRWIASHLCNYIVVLTKKSEEDYERIFHLKKKKIVSIYNSIKDTLVDDNRQYDSKSRIIITAGRFTKEKGFDLLLEVAKIVMPANPSWQWYIYGEGPLDGMIKKKIKEYGLTDSVIMKGFTDKMEEVYESAAMYVLPSYREGLPLVLLEAKAFKLPSISFDIVTGPNEIIEEGINGHLISPYDVKSMAECINHLIQNEDYRKYLSENAYSNIDKFQESIVLREWENLITKLNS